MNIDYSEYLNSPEWQQKRKEALDRAGNKCSVCAMPGDKVTLHVHHNTYQRVHNELPEDLAILCEDHHGMFHGDDYRKGFDDGFEAGREGLKEGKGA